MSMETAHWAQYNGSSLPSYPLIIWPPTPENQNLLENRGRVSQAHFYPQCQCTAWHHSFTPLPRIQKSTWPPEGTSQTFVGCMDEWVESLGTRGRVIWENVIPIATDLEGVGRAAGKD